MLKFVLRHARLNLWDKHMTTGRFNQVGKCRNIVQNLIVTRVAYAVAAAQQRHVWPTLKATFLPGGFLKPTRGSLLLMGCPSPRLTLRVRAWQSLGWRTPLSLPNSAVWPKPNATFLPDGFPKPSRGSLSFTSNRYFSPRRVPQAQSRLTFVDE